MTLPNDVIPVIQSWTSSFLSPIGIVNFIEDKQYEFYNGDYSGSVIIATTQNLFDNPFLKIDNPSTLDIPEFPWSSTLKSKFANSNFDTLINNVLPSRKSTFNLNADYDKNVYIPDNILDILSGSAPKTETPDSNYTSQRVILPRYLGSKLKSADYNFYTPAGNLTFLNGETGYWGGDISYGKTAVIDSYPRYFAHFKYSKENKEFWDTSTYVIDALIECPQEDLKGAVTEPKVLKIEDDNQRLYEVANNFVKGRKVKIDFKKEIYKGIDYQTLETAPQKIMQGGSKFKLVCGNELGKVSYIESCSFAESTWATMFSNTPQEIYELLQENVAVLDYNKKDFINLEEGNFNKDYYLKSIKDAFVLKGGDIGIASSTIYVSNTDPTSQTLIWGPGLGLIHTYNQKLKKQEIVNNNINDPTIYIPGIPRNLPLNSPLKNTKDPDNYFTFKVTGSVTNLSSYEYYKIPFLIERGDQIRVTWSDLSAPQAIYTSQDFVVTGVEKGNSIEEYYGVGELDITKVFEYHVGYIKVENNKIYDFIDFARDITSEPYNFEAGYAAFPLSIAFQGPFFPPPGGDFEFTYNQPLVIYNSKDNTTSYDDDVTNVPRPGLTGPGTGYTIVAVQVVYSKTALNPDNFLNLLKPLPGSEIYDTIKVYPNPLDFNIPDNKIKAFTIRKRIDSDNSVVIFQTPPKNVDGFNTLSGQGFLIPNDFSQTQKDNVLTLINALEAKNVFKPDE